MIKKIVSADGSKIPKKLKNLKQLRKQRLKEQKPDTFELSSKQNIKTDAKRPYPSDCDNLEFKIQKIRFYPEDIEKMKSMELNERIAYKRQLKENKQYIVLEDSAD